MKNIRLTRSERKKLLGLEESGRKDFYYHYSPFKGGGEAMLAWLENDKYNYRTMKRAARDSFIVNIEIPEYEGTEREKRAARHKSRLMLREIIGEVVEALDEMDYNRIYLLHCDAESRGVKRDMQGIVDFLLRRDERVQAMKRIKRAADLVSWAEHRRRKIDAGERKIQALVRKRDEIYCEQYTGMLIRAVAGEADAWRLKDASMRRIEAMQREIDRIKGQNGKKDIFGSLYALPLIGVTDRAAGEEQELKVAECITM